MDAQEFTEWARELLNDDGDAKDDDPRVVMVGDLRRIIQMAGTGIAAREMIAGMHEAFQEVAQEAS